MQGPDPSPTGAGSAARDSTGAAEAVAGEGGGWLLGWGRRDATRPPRRRQFSQPMGWSGQFLVLATTLVVVRCHTTDALRSRFLRVCRARVLCMHVVNTKQFYRVGERTIHAIRLRSQYILIIITRLTHTEQLKQTPADSLQVQAGAQHQEPPRERKPRARAARGAELLQPRGERGAPPRGRRRESTRTTAACGGRVVQWRRGEPRGRPTPFPP